MAYNVDLPLQNRHRLSDVTAPVSGYYYLIEQTSCHVRNAQWPELRRIGPVTRSFSSCWEHPSSGTLYNNLLNTFGESRCLLSVLSRIFRLDRESTHSRIFRAYPGSWLSIQLTGCVKKSEFVVWIINGGSIAGIAWSITMFSVTTFCSYVPIIVGSPHPSSSAFECKTFRPYHGDLVHPPKCAWTSVVCIFAFQARRKVPITLPTIGCARALPSVFSAVTNVHLPVPLSPPRKH